MSSAKLQIGDEATWLRTLRGGYGYTQWIPVVIRDLSKGRAKVEATTLSGATKQVWVRKYNLIRKDTPVEPVAAKFLSNYPDSWVA